MEDLEEYKADNYTNVLVLELNHVNSLDEEECENYGFKEKFPAICRLFKDNEFDDINFTSKFEFNMHKVLWN